MDYSVGTLLKVNNHSGKVIGYIEYKNPNDLGKTWVEYRVMGPSGEWWLSCDDYYKEYSVSRPANHIRGNIGPEWHKVDSGTQIVTRYGGDVDVDPGERASFVEYEDASEDHTLSVEMWEDGTEYSLGEYVEKSEIEVTGFSQPASFGSGFGSGSSADNKKALIAVMGIVIMFVIILGTIGQGASSAKKISSILKTNKARYTYTTSITGNEKQKADVYTYHTSATTDTVAKLLIDAIEGNTESVTQMDEQEDSDIAILTSKEYCLIYHPENDKDTVLIQVSDRKYNYTSDNAPYRSSTRSSSWYRSHYYSSGYTKDSTTFKSSPSAYKMYDGNTIHNIGNGYFDSYSNSVRQSSINSRNSSSGGLSSGK